MGWFYFASIRSENQYQAEYLAEKYHGQTFVYNIPGVLRCTPSRMVASASREDDTDKWWTSIMVADITDSGIADEQEADRATQFDNIIYGMLRNELYFLTAATGVEVGEYPDLGDLRDDIRDVKWPNFGGIDGLVVRTDLLKDFLYEPSTGPSEVVPIGFEYFSPTHHWIPKKPVIYKGRAQGNNG